MMLLHWPCFTWKFFIIWFHKILQLIFGEQLLCTFSGQTLYTLHERDQSKWKCVRLLSARIKIHQILVVFETTHRFFWKFYISVQCHETWLLCTFLAAENFSGNFNRTSLSSTTLLKFQVSSQKSEMLHFDRLLLSKSYKVSAKKVQKSYISWHKRVIQS